MDLIQCAKCKKDFDWDKTYRQQDSPGSHIHNPPGHGNFRPRAFCPQCGSLVAEWDIDRYQDRNRWRWYEKNAELNANRELPPSPFTHWGLDIPPDACVTVPEDHIDIKLVRRLLGESVSEEVPEKEIKAETLLSTQIFTNANEELSRYFKSRSTKYFNRRAEAFETLKSYVEGKGQSDAKAIALLGMIEYYDHNRDLARKMFDRAMKLDESYALCYLGLGILDLRETDSGSAERGVERLNKAIALDPWLSDAYVWKARIQKRRLNDPQGAWNSLQAAVSAIGEDNLKEHPHGYWVFLELGLLCIYNSLGGLNDAIRYLETSLRMNPNDYEASIFLMPIYEALDRWAEVTRVQAAYKGAEHVELNYEGINDIRRFVSNSLLTKDKEASNKNTNIKVDALIFKLSDPDRTAHESSIREMIALGKPAVEPLIQYLQHPDKWARLMAAAALGKMGDLRAIEPLKDTLYDSDEGVRHMVNLALKELLHER